MRFSEIQANPRVAPYSVAGLATGGDGFYRNFFKRAIDVTLVSLAMIVVFPVLLILCAFIARDGHSPLYRSPRVGRGGRVFYMLKLRTMVPNADARLIEYLRENPAAADEWHRMQKLRNDPRITRIGALLRKTSIDELPQLWNVLAGDMSLVGPRPMMPDQRDIYPGHLYYAMRPGLTGPWQVSDRNTCTFAKRADFDDSYARSISFATDLRLILRTFSVVVRGTGC